MKLERPLFLIAIFIAIFPAAILQAATTDPSNQCPRFQFNPPDAYKGSMKYSFLVPGSVGSKVESFTSVCSGFWLSAARARQSWGITVSKKDDPKVASAFNAKDAYAVDLARADSGNATPYLYARFQKFSFPWGNAVGYFVQTTQDATWPEPNNVQLTYEIRGVTNDHQDTIVAKFEVRHPRLPDGTNVLDAHGNVRTLTSFPSYKLLEKSSPDSFQPSLTEIQEMVGSVVIMKLKKPENSEKKSAMSGASGQWKIASIEPFVDVPRFQPFR